MMSRTYRTRFRSSIARKYVDISSLCSCKADFKTGRSIVSFLDRTAWSHSASLLLQPPPPLPSPLPPGEEEHEEDVTYRDPRSSADVTKNPHSYGKNAVCLGKKNVNFAIKDLLDRILQNSPFHSIFSNF